MAEDPCTPVTLTGSGGAQITACAYGGHLLGWVPAGGVQRLWLSPAARCGAGAAIRGGVPVIFPQFAARGPLPRHGFARDRAWRRLPDDAPGRWRAVLTDDDATRATWPHRFELVLTVSARDGRLEQELAVHNTGDVPWSFSAALHTYLSVRDPDAVIEGVGGMLAEDNAAPPGPDGDQPLVPLGAPGLPLPALTPRDVALLGVGRAVHLRDAQLGRTTLEAVGFSDRVIWNPGPGHGLGDVPEGAEEGFVCIEAARLPPVTLQPAEVWIGREVLTVEPPSPG